MRAGYKMTELGEIPESWEVEKIEKIADIKGGKRLPKGKVLTETPTPFPYLRVADMFMGGINHKNILYVPEDVYPFISNYTISHNDLFISVAGTLGIVGFIPFFLSGANLSENADKLTNIKINKEFLFYILSSSIVQDLIEKEKTSNAQPKLALIRIREFKIPLPPLPEQQKIASILSTVDEKIEVIEEQITQTRELKKGLMQKLLTRGIGHTQFKDSVLGEIPESWEVGYVGEAFNICNNLRFPINRDLRKTIPGQYPYYGPTKIQDYINEYRVNGKYALIGEDGDHFLKWNEWPMTLLIQGKFNVNNHAHLVQGGKNTITEWFFYYFNQRELTTFLTRQGAGRYKLTKNALSKIPIPLPSLQEQQKIAIILTSVDDKLEVLQSKKQEYQELKKGLMQQLLTGKVQVVV